MRNTFCLECYTDRCGEIIEEEVEARNLAGTIMRPASITMKTRKEVGLYLGMPAWQQWNGNTWIAVLPEETPNRIIFANYTIATAIDVIGLHGPIVTVCRSQDDAETNHITYEIPPNVDLDMVMTPPSPGSCLGPGKTSAAKK